MNEFNWELVSDWNAAAKCKKNEVAFWEKTSRSFLVRIYCDIDGSFCGRTNSATLPTNSLNGCVRSGLRRKIVTSCSLIPVYFTYYHQQIELYSFVNSRHIIDSARYNTYTQPSTANALIWFLVPFHLLVVSPLRKYFFCVFAKCRGSARAFLICMEFCIIV